MTPLSLSLSLDTHGAAVLYTYTNVYRGKTNNILLVAITTTKEKCTRISLKYTKTMSLRVVRVKNTYSDIVKNFGRLFE